MESETGFIQTLLDFGKQLNGQMMIIPTSDSDVLILSKHARELEKYYYLPIPAYETVQKLVNKKIFYKLLAKMDIPHPKTYFPESLAELRKKGLETKYPYLIKPTYPGPFYREFGRKNFVIQSPRELFWAIARLRDKNLEVMIQDIVPGNEIYMFYTYFNKKSEPLAICGYDKIRQFPDDFGSGSFCRSNLRSSPLKECIQLLKAIEYHGFAEPELKRDPRDGKYKLLEINARTTTENRLAAACGADVEYISYLEAAGRLMKTPLAFQSGVFWIDEFVELSSCWKRLRSKEIGIEEIIRTFGPRKVYSVAAWDDLAPFIIVTVANARKLVSQSFGALRRRSAKHARLMNKPTP
jgi:predicted ATP-grasp superfamily ATP-dependent carboligase